MQKTHIGQIFLKIEQVGDNMTLQDLLDKCEYAYYEKDYRNLMGLCDEVLKRNQYNQTAIGYKSISYVFLGQPEKAVDMLEDAIKRYPNNYYPFSTKIRMNLSVGERITYQWPGEKKRWVRSLTAFYEIGSCDLYLIDYIPNRQVGLKDVLGLSLGIKLQIR